MRIIRNLTRIISFNNNKVSKGSFHTLPIRGAFTVQYCLLSLEWV